MNFQLRYITLLQGAIDEKIAIRIRLHFLNIPDWKVLFDLGIEVDDALEMAEQTEV
ncbi:MAG: hypothetical protein QNL62_20355 [Gammaproteobacteria bacterium]|nr:hypothetical protein [Gammaproteobacteria bacterium]